VKLLRVRVAVLSVGAVLSALFAVVLPPLGNAPAAATHPCASGPSGTYDPNPSADHDACTGSIRPAPPVGTEVVLTLADSGRTVTLALGQRLRVELQSSGGLWPDIAADITAGSALHRYRFDVLQDRSVAGFTALSPTSGEQVAAMSDASCLHSQPACAIPQRQWQVTVVVENRPDASPTPSPSCTRTSLPPVPYDVVVLDEASDSSTVTVKLGQSIDVVFGGCSSDADWAAAKATGPLFRERASANNPGGATSWFRAVAAGTTDISATRDAPCLHEASPCAVDPHTWRVTVQVVDPGRCEMTNAVVSGSTTTYATGVPAGTTVRLHGHVRPGATVQVWFQPYGARAFEPRRELVADGDGAFETTFRPVVDQRWYATSGQCSTPPGRTTVLPVVTGPRSVGRGSTVPVVVRGPAGQPVALYMHGPGGSYALRRTGRLDASGVWRTSYAAHADQRYYAATGPDRRTSDWVLTRLG
jgi:hypothetical protein